MDQSPATEYSVPNQQLRLVSMTLPEVLRESQLLWPNGTWLQMECLWSAQEQRQRVGETQAPSNS